MAASVNEGQTPPMTPLKTINIPAQSGQSREFHRSDPALAQLTVTGMSIPDPHNLVGRSCAANGSS